MADALLKAGLASKSDSEDSGTKNNRNGSADCPVQTSGKNKSDAELFREAYEGVTEIKADGPAVVGKKRRKRKNKRSIKRTKSIPKVPTYIDVDGRTKIAVKGEGFLELGNRKKAHAKNIESRPPQALKVSPKTTINLSALQDDVNHLYGLSLLESETLSESPKESQGEVDLVLGLDFGTTYCKVIVQEPDSGRAWAIPFSEGSNNPYILSTKVISTGKDFRLSGEGETVGNLKVPLLIKEMPAGHVRAVIAFLTLVMRHTKAWVKENISDQLGGMTPFWTVNMGLPARNLEDRSLTETFRKILWSGMLLSQKSGAAVTPAEVDHCLAMTQRILREGDEELKIKGYGSVHVEQLGIFPEIAAQIYGYLQSDLWDRNHEMFLLVDVGGGTVDGALFRVTEEGGDIRFHFLKSSVKHLGVYILHRERLSWHFKQLNQIDPSGHLKDEFQNMLSKSVMPGEVPGEIGDYLDDAEYPKETSDKLFYNQFAHMLWDDLIQPVRNGLNHYGEHWDGLPFLLCGGGRSISLYNRFLEKLNDQSSSTMVNLRQLTMWKPDNLVSKGIGEDEYQRLSVAYGLSFRDFAEVLTVDMLTDHPPTQGTDVSENYIGSEHV